MMYKRLLSLAFLAATTNAFAAVTVVEPTNQATLLDIDGDNQFEFIETEEPYVYAQTGAGNTVMKSVLNFDLSQMADSNVEFATIDFDMRSDRGEGFQIDILAFNGEENIEPTHGSQSAELVGTYRPRDLTWLHNERIPVSLDPSVLSALIGANLSLRFEVSQGSGNSQVLTSAAIEPPKLNLVLSKRIPDQPSIPAPTPSQVLSEDFEAYSAGENPVEWFDTRWGNSLSEQDNFQAALNIGNAALSTSSTYTNIHSHYSGSVLESVEGGYEFEGRLQFSDSQSGIGVTFFSQYPNADHYYRLRRYGGKPYFHLSSHGTSVQGDIASDFAPGTNEWVKFKIRVEDTGTQTTIKARLWAEGSEEPNEWQIDAYDSSSNRLISGTIGVWSMRAGQKSWDDFSVTQLTPPAPLVATPDFRYLTLEEAVSLANANNLLIGQIEYVTNVVIGPGHTIGQVPSANTNVEEGSEIALTLSGSTAGVQEMPNLRGLRESEVSAFAASNELVIGNIQYEYSSYIPAGYVTMHFPYVGQMALPPSEMRLEVSLGERPNYYYQNNFSGTAGTNPNNWFDTRSSNRMSEDDSLFKLFDLDTGTALGTASTDTNIHSHYVGSALDGLNDLEFTGKMRVSDANSGIGVTVFSQYPNADKYYRLRRWERGGSFHLSPHGTSLSGTTDSGVSPAPDQWYQFRLRATDTGTETQIKAKIWLSGEAEPTSWQIDAYDSSSSRQTTGTIGVWSMGPGSKFWDDFAIDTLY